MKKFLHWANQAGRREWILCGLAALISLSGYLLNSWSLAGPGFPLDDSWIYQTYARNLASQGEWAFTSGQASGGSTGPLWTLLLAVGYRLQIHPFLWTFGLGWLSLTALGVFAARLFARLMPDKRRVALWVGLLLTLEWHLVWAAASGMETLLYAVVIFGVLARLNMASDGPRFWFWSGVLVGVSVWLRPDGISLLGPAGFYLLLGKGSRSQRLSGLGQLGLGVLLPFGLYLLFNRWVGGAWWPTTFYAKQAEYQDLQHIPLYLRWFQLWSLSLVGVGAVLLPGFVLALIHAWRARAWGLLAAGIWFLGFISLYAWRLPLVYQHGRYLMPAMPVYFFLGVFGMVHWLRNRRLHYVSDLLAQAWPVIAGILLAAFWWLGSNAYARDVAVVETEMVATARWIFENTEPDARIAAHDIGALGYFADRQLLDLAGLISPDVIPFMRDEDRLREYLDQQQADYLVLFPEAWYEELVQYGALIYSTEAPISPGLGGENMAVYRWGVDD